MSNSIKREEFDDVVTITFDQENSVANVFNESMFSELNEQLDFIEDNQESVKGVVFNSAKPSIFIAGADLKSFADDPSPERISHLITLGQNTFYKQYRVFELIIYITYGRFTRRTYKKKERKKEEI